MRRLHLDLLGGIAGDMFAAALLDLRPELEAAVRRAIDGCPLLEDVAVARTAWGDGVLNGSRFAVSRAGAVCDRNMDAAATGHHHGFHDDHHHAGTPTAMRPAGSGDTPHGHHHVAWREIRASLAAMPLDTGVVARAMAIFTLLAEAEGRVHGVAADDVIFHEVGAWDSIADVLAAAVMIEAYGPARWTCGSVPIGSGRVRTGHGLLPVPAPATAVLLEGFAMIDDGIGGERVTPTGAAILRHLCADHRAVPSQAAILSGAGHGFGIRSLPGVSNCLRVLVFNETAAGYSSDVVAVLECEIDDQSAEDLAIALAHLRDHPSVIDAVQAPVFGKKGRMMTHVRVLAEPAATDAVAALLFDETTTIGLRYSLFRRHILPRTMSAMASDGRPLTVKTVERPGATTRKVDADGLADIPGHAAREQQRRRLPEETVP